MNLKKVIMVLSSIFLIVMLVFVLFLNLKPQKIAVLTYHGVVKKVEDINGVDISTEYFEKQMKYLSDNNFKTITMDEFYRWKKGKLKLPKKSVLITFDDGWKNTYTNALPIMEKYNITSNVFVVWKYSENCTIEKSDTYLNSKDIEDIKENHKSLKILSHSYNLHDREKAESNDYRIYFSDIQQVKQNYPGIKYYAYPYGIHNDEYEKALKDSGYKLAFTFGPYSFASKDDYDYAVPRIGIFESTSFSKLKLKLFLGM